MMDQKVFSAIFGVPRTPDECNAFHPLTVGPFIESISLVDETAAKS
jgi:hypothetical protein